MKRELVSLTGAKASESLFSPNIDGRLVEMHPSTDLSTTLKNWADNSVATEVGALTFGAGFANVSGSNTTPRGFNTGKIIGEEDDCTFIAFVKGDGGAAGFLNSVGTAGLRKALAAIALNGNPAAGETVTLNGQVIEVVASGAGGMQVNRGATSADTAQAITTVINANYVACGFTAICPAGVGNTVIRLVAVTGGTAANSITLTKTGTIFSVTAPSGGAAAQTVNLGLQSNGANYRFFNSNIGSGGLATVPKPVTSSYVGVIGWGRYRDFPRIRVYQGGVLGPVYSGTTSGYLRDPTAQLQTGANSFGAGSIPLAFTNACARAIEDDTEQLEHMARIAAQLVAAGLPVL